MSQQPIPLEVREQRYLAADEALAMEATRWLTRRTRGPVPAPQDGRLTDAIDTARRAANRLEEARKRA